MVDPDRCELHDVALFVGEDEAEDLVRLARSPIGDECQVCPVCRSAREYVERRLTELAGYAPPPGETADAAWRKLQTAIEEAKTSIRKPA
jgi:hypothetical protein